MIHVTMKQSSNPKPFPKFMELIDKSRGKLIVYFYKNNEGLPIYATCKAFEDHFGTKYNVPTPTEWNMSEFQDYNEELILQNK